MSTRWKKQNGQISKGDLVVLTSGEYSDYELFTLCRANCDLDLDRLTREFAPDEKLGRWDVHCGFVKWLVVDKAVLTELDYREWWVGVRYNWQNADAPAVLYQLADGDNLDSAS